MIKVRIIVMVLILINIFWALAVSYTHFSLDFFTLLSIMAFQCAIQNKA